MAKLKLKWSGPKEAGEQPYIIAITGDIDAVRRGAAGMGAKVTQKSGYVEVLFPGFVDNPMEKVRAIERAANK